MALKRKKKSRPTPTKAGVLKPSQRFLIAKSGKLSKTNLVALFSSPQVWDSLTGVQQLSVLESLNVTQLFGLDHPRKLGSGNSNGDGKYMNYFITSTHDAPGLEIVIGQEGGQVRPEGGEVFFDMSNHLERFKDHLEAGRFDPRWQREGEEVSLRRVRGDFDGYWEIEGEGAIGEVGRARVEEVRRLRKVRKERGEE